MKAEAMDKTFELLRELPVEVTVEQVGGMIAAFPLVAPAGWFSHTLSRLGGINLNSILMTTAGTLIIGATVFYYSPSDPAPKLSHRAVEPATAVERVVEPAAELPELDSKPVIRTPESTTAAPFAVDGSKSAASPARSVPAPGVSRTPAVAIIPAVPTISVIPAPTPLPGYPSPFPASTNKQFDLSGFTAVAVEGSMGVVIEQGAFAVSAEGDEGLMENLELVVQNRTLTIGTHKSKDAVCQHTGEKAVTVRVRMPLLDRIALVGSGDIHASGFAGVEHLDLRLSGSGDIRFNGFKGLGSLVAKLDGSGDLVGEELEVGGKTTIELSGSGDVRMTGETEHVEVHIVGSGDVDARELKAGTCDAQVIGSGDAYVNCPSGCNTRITGSGDVHNTGNAGGGGQRANGNTSN